ncbi:MAG TPA: glycosyl hydrolase family 8 [Cytophagaceae bacterium]
MIKKLLILSVGLTLSVSVVFSQNRPFPQEINYPGCIKPNNVTQASMNTSVKEFYDYWKNKYLKNDLSSLPGGYYVKGEITGSPNGYIPLGSSEGQGYGMIITALMAGYDSNAKTYFDGLFKTARAYKSSINSNLMGWVVADNINAQGSFSSATDGDMDIAYALLLAHYQWGSGGAINYLEEAKKMITNGIKADEINSSKRTNLGDWDNNAYNTRPSDWMPGHMHAYKVATGDVFWDEVANTVYNMISSITASHSSATGLMPDFVVGATPTPANPNFLEGPNDGNYYYNACRYPLRIVIDYAHFGTPAAKNAVNKIVDWAKTKTGGSPGSIKAGYTLAGNDLAGSNYQSSIFIGPMVAAGVVDVTHQNWVNSGWATIQGMKASYFEDSFNLLTMLFISGNWWAPVPDESNQAPTVTITAPANNASYTQGESFTISASASDADGSISKVAFYMDGILLGEVNSSPYSLATSTIVTGTHTLTAIATDDKGKSTTSAGVSITITVNTTQTPFNGTPFAIPGKIEAEQYDIGMPDIAYKDMTELNEGNANYRNDQVDIEECTDVGLGYNIGYIVTGEWLEYTVDVKEAASYTIDARVAAITSGKTFHIELDGENISGAITVPNTGGWQIWQTTTVTTPVLSTGVKILRIVMDSDDFNINYITFTKVHVNENPTVSLTSPLNNSVHISGTAITITATATDSDGSISKVEFYNGTDKIGESPTSPYSISWTPGIGTYSLTAKAIDDEGASTVSDPIIVEVYDLTTDNYGYFESAVSVVNPFNDYLLIEINNLSGYETVELYNIYGVKVGAISENEIASGQTYYLSTSHLAKGYYILKLSANGVTLQKKLLKD